MIQEPSKTAEMDLGEEPVSTPGVLARTRRAAPAAMALVIGLAALTAQASESDLVRDIQRYCTVCWRNARLDPTLWDDCTQEVCCRLLTKARAGELDLTQVLAEDTSERRELVRAIDMVRKRVQRAKRHQPIEMSDPGRSRSGSARSATASSWARSSKPPAGPYSRPGRIASSSSGCAAGRSRDRRRVEHAREPGQR